MVILKGYPFVGVSLYSLCEPIGFGGRAGSGVSTSHLTPNLLAAVTVVGGGAVEGGARVRTRCEPGLLCSVEDTPRC